MKNNYLYIIQIILLGCDNMTTGNKLSDNKNQDTLSSTVNLKNTEESTITEVDEYSKSINIETYFTTPVSDTMIYFEIDFPCAIFTSPSSNEIEEMKQGKEDDFYIAADDIMWYNAQAGKLIDSLKIKSIYTEKKYLKLNKQRNKFIFLNTKTNKPSWNLFLFTPTKEPIIVNTASLSFEDIDNYFNKK